MDTALISWRVRGYEWGLKRSLVPLTSVNDIEAAYCAIIDPKEDFREIMYRVMTGQFSEGALGDFTAFEHGAKDALPLVATYEDGDNFSLEQISTALNRDVSFVRAEVAKGKLKAAKDGKLWYVDPPDFETWYRSKKWRRAK